MYDVGGKLLRGIKSMYVDSSASVRIKGGESERFRIFVHLFYHGLTSICDPMVDNMISYHRGEPCLTCVLGSLLLRYTTDDTIGHSEGNERVTSGGNGPISSSSV